MAGRRQASSVADRPRRKPTLIAHSGANVEAYIPSPLPRVTAKKDLNQEKQTFTKGYIRVLIRYPLYYIFEISLHIQLKFKFVLCPENLRYKSASLRIDRRTARTDPPRSLPVILRDHGGIHACRSAGEKRGRRGGGFCTFPSKLPAYTGVKFGTRRRRQALQERQQREFSE